METQKCKNYEKCSIFNGTLKGMEMTTKNYIKLYCEGSWDKCKRYIVKERTGKCPKNLLPNSIKSIDEIIAALDD